MAATDPITRALEEVRQTFATDTSGALPDYIPELSEVDPDLFGISLASLGGRIYSAGDAKSPFTIQSVSKPFVYAMALADHGLEAVLARVGAEPSGEAFNAISLEPETGRPLNPMINAGAIVATSLVEAVDAAARFERIRATLSAFAGRALKIDDAVYRSELETGDNNRALGYLMRNAGSLAADVDETLDVYFRQCALLVTTRDLAVMAATLANGGVNPVTGETVVAPRIASHALTIMGTCGMYDFSGEWLLRVGLPAKSGVSGALIAAKLAQFGIGLFSPPLDERGNSVRAVATCRALAERFELHLLNDPGNPPPVIWLDETVADGGTFKNRGKREQQALHKYGKAIRIRGLQGEIGFAAAESVLQSFKAPAKPAQVRRWLILDLDRVGRVHRSAQAVFEAMVGDLHEIGMTVVVADPARRGLIPGLREFRSLRAAMESCEDALLRDLS
jgi:glutaminase